MGLTMGLFRKHVELNWVLSSFVPSQAVSTLTCSSSQSLVRILHTAISLQYAQKVSVSYPVPFFVFTVSKLWVVHFAFLVTLQPAGLSSA